MAVVRKTIAALAAVAGLLALSACVKNESSIEKQPDGSVKIVDTQQVPEEYAAYRQEGRALAKICVSYTGDLPALRKSLTSLGNVQRQTLFGPAWEKKTKNAFSFPIYTMHEKAPCEFTFLAGIGKQYFKGAEAELIEQGFTKGSSSIWQKGSTKVSLTGSVRYSGASSSSNVSIKRILQ